MYVKDQIFSHLKVIELASVLAGPSVGMFFAELGAQVIKIEHKSSGGDVTRRWKLPVEDPEKPISAYYASVNWGKEVRFLNLNEAADYEAFLNELKDADMLIQNFQPASAEKLKVDYTTLSRKNEQLIYAELNSYPHTPDRPAYDVVIQAESGYISMMGYPGERPVKMPVAMIDVLAAHQLKEGILTALYHREKEGKGTKVSVSLYEAALSGLVNQASNYLMTGSVPQPMGSAHPNIAPYGDAFQTADGVWFVLAVGSDVQFKALCRVLGKKELATSPEYVSNGLRVQNRASLVESLQKLISTYPCEVLVTAMKENGVPFGKIRDLAEVFNEPIAKHAVLEYEYPEGSIGKSIRSAIFDLH